MYYIYFILICHWTDNKENKQKSDHEKKKSNGRNLRKKLQWIILNIKLKLRDCSCCFKTNCFPMCICVYFCSCGVVKCLKKVVIFQSTNQMKSKSSCSAHSKGCLNVYQVVTCVLIPECIFSNSSFSCSL